METKTNELIQVVEQSGLDKTKGQKITETLSVFFDKAAEWQTTIESLTINSIDEVGKMKTAKEIRLSLKNKRLEGEKLVTAAREIVKNRMADDVLEDKLWLKSGQIMKAVYDNLEGKAEWIEKYAERYEAEQKEIRKSERTAELTPYAEFVPFGIDLGNMSDEDYTKLLNGAKMQQNAKIEAEAKAEAERLENIRLENERIEKQRIENERLKAEAIEREKQIEAERVEREAEEVKAKQERERIQKEADDKLAEEKRKALELENQLKAEKQKELDRIQAERINAENERLEREKAAEAELSKGDAAKMNDLINSIESLTTAYVFKSKKHQTIQASINELLIKTANYAKSKI
jgi:hypothetical protein